PPRWPAIRAPSRPRAASAPPTASRSSSHAIESSPRTVSAGTARSASATSVACWSSRVPFSDDLRNELAAVAPRKECDRLAELSGLFHAAGSVHLRGRGEVAVHLDLGNSAVARRAFALLRSFGVGSEVRTYTQRAFE